MLLFFCQTPVEPSVSLVTFGRQYREVEVVSLLLVAGVRGLEVVGGVWVEQPLRLQEREQGDPVSVLDEITAVVLDGHPNMVLCGWEALEGPFTRIHTHTHTHIHAFTCAHTHTPVCVFSPSVSTAIPHTLCRESS